MAPPEANECIPFSTSKTSASRGNAKALQSTHFP